MRARSIIVLVALVVGAVAGTGCDETPARGFERFYEALADGDAEGASARLTRRARSQLEAAAAPRGLSPAQALAATFPKTTVKDIAVVEEIVEEVGGNDAPRAILEVTDVLGRKERVLMRKEDGRWRVDFEGVAP